MKNLLILGVVFISLFSCSSSKEGRNKIHKIAYQVIKIDSIKNIYIIYAVRLDTIYKILSVKQGKEKKAKLILINQYYPFELESLFINNFNGNYDIKPDAIDLLTGVDFHGTSINIDDRVKNEKRDLFEAKNIKGLYYIEN